MARENGTHATKTKQSTASSTNSTDEGDHADVLGESKRVILQTTKFRMIIFRKRRAEKTIRKS